MRQLMEKWMELVKNSENDAENSVRTLQEYFYHSTK